MACKCLILLALCMPLEIFCVCQYGMIKLNSSQGCSASQEYDPPGPFVITFGTTPTSDQDICLPTNSTSEDDETNEVSLLPYNGFSLEVNSLDDVFLFFCSDDVTEATNYLNGSCITEDMGTIHVHTDPLLFDVLSELTVQVGDVNFTVKYFPPGIHVRGPTTFNLDDIANADTTLLSVLVIIDKMKVFEETEWNVCVKTDNNGALPYSAVDIFGITQLTSLEGPTGCVTSGKLLNEFLFIEYKLIDARLASTKTSSSPDLADQYVVVVTTQDCNALEDGTEEFTSDEITIVVSPTPTPTASPTTSTTDEGMESSSKNVGPIVGGVVGSFIVIVLVVIIAVVIVWRSRRCQHLFPGKFAENGHMRPMAPLGQRDRVTEVTPPPLPSSDTEALLKAREENNNKVKTVYVCNAAQLESDKIFNGLATEHKSTLEELHEHEENGNSYELQVQRVLRELHCTRLYIFYKNNLEWLKDNRNHVWRVVRDLTTRPLPPAQLNKVTLVRVYDVKSDGVKDTLEGSVLTVNILRSEVERSSVDAAKYILSKVRMEARFHEEMDGNSAKNSPDGSPKPSPGPFSSVPATLSTPTNTADPSQSLPLHEVPPVEHHENNNTVNDPVVTVLSGIQLTLENILIAGKGAAKSAAQIASNTDGLGQHVAETRDTVNTIADNQATQAVPVQAEEPC